MRDPILTIAIPTYNRPSFLLRTVSALFEQMDDKTVVLVLDNCSEQPADQVLQSILRDHSGRIQVVRHRLNVGGNANVLRCIELANSPYVWVLGDDDIPHPGGIAAIQRNIERQPDACFWKFSSCLRPYSQETKLASPDDFLKSVGSLPMALWVSNCVLNREAVAPGFTMASHWASSSAPQLVMALLSLKRGKQAVISPDVIAEFTAPSSDQTYDRATIFAGLPLLLELPLDWSTKKMLGRMIGKMFSTPESLALWISQTPGDLWCPEEKLYHYRYLGNALYRSFSGPGDRWQYAILERSMWLLDMMGRLDRRFTGGRLLGRPGLSQPEGLSRI